MKSVGLSTAQCFTLSPNISIITILHYDRFFFLYLQEEVLHQRELELKQLSAQLQTTKVQLSTLQSLRDGEALNDQQAEKLRQTYEAERRQFQNDVKELEAQISRLEVTKRGLSSDNSRLLANLDEKDKTIQVRSV